MTTLIGRIDKLIFLSGDKLYGVYSFKHGRLRSTLVAYGQQPKVRKSVDYKVVGEWRDSDRGRRFVAKSIEDVGVVPILTGAGRDKHMAAYCAR